MAEIDNRLNTLSIHLSTDFSRIPHTLKNCNTFKATELRLIILYLAPVLFKGILSIELCNNFMSFHVAMRLLTSPITCTEKNGYAQSLLNYIL